MAIGSDTLLRKQDLNLFNKYGCTVGGLRNKSASFLCCFVSLAI